MKRTPKLKSKSLQRLDRLECLRRVKEDRESSRNLIDHRNVRNYDGCLGYSNRRVKTPEKIGANDRE